MSHNRRKWPPVDFVHPRFRGSSPHLAERPAMFRRIRSTIEPCLPRPAKEPPNGDGSSTTDFASWRGGTLRECGCTRGTDTTSPTASLGSLRRSRPWRHGYNDLSGTRASSCARGGARGGHADIYISCLRKPAAIRFETAAGLPRPRWPGRMWPGSGQRWPHHGD
jgi:hypothetical protein